MAGNGGATMGNEADVVGGEVPRDGRCRVEVEPCSGWRRRPAPAALVVLGRGVPDDGDRARQGGQSEVGARRGSRRLAFSRKLRSGEMEHASVAG
jgi:hypothetical protein